MCGAEPAFPSFVISCGAAIRASRSDPALTRPKSKWCLSSHRSATRSDVKRLPEIANPTGSTLRSFPALARSVLPTSTKSSLERSHLPWEGGVAGDISTANDGIPNILGEYRKPSLQEAAVERGIMCDDQNDRTQQIHGRGYPSYSSGLFPARNASAVSPNIVILTAQSRPFIFPTNPSYNGLTFE